jgi:hypothetical protein
MRLLRVPLPLSPNTDKTGQLVAVCICSPHSLQGAALYNTLQHHLTTRHSLEIHTPVYPGSTLPSARFRLPPRAPSYADPMDHHTTTTCEVEQQRHRDHQRAPEVSGNGDAEGAPPPHILIKCERCKYVEASRTSMHGDKLKHTDTGIKLGPQTACRDLQVSDRSFNQKHKDTHPHIPGTKHGTLHTIGMPQNLPIGARVVRTEEPDNITNTTPHSPNSSHTPPPATHRATNTNISCHAITTNQNTPPHTHGTAAGDIYTHHHRPLHTSPSILK